VKPASRDTTIASGKEAESNQMSVMQPLPKKPNVVASEVQGLPSTGPAYVTVIEPTSGWQRVNLRELVQYRDLLRFLTWRSIKVRYAQSAVGFGWAVIQPAFQIGMFTLVFGRLAAIDTDGVPHAAFYLATMVAWTYFANAVTSATDSLVSNANMLGKIYFPRVILPLSATLAALFDFAIAFFLSLGVLLACGIMPAGNAVLLPLLVLLMASCVFGISLWTSALAIQYRDVKHAMTFVVQLLMYASPVIYPTSRIPAELSWSGLTINPQRLYALNPMVGVIEGFRAALVGSRSMPYEWIFQGTVVTAMLIIGGLYYFRGREKVFADVA